MATQQNPNNLQDSAASQQNSDVSALQTSSLSSQAQPTSAGTVNSAAGGTGQKVVIGVFSSVQNAEKAVSNLRQQGFTNEEINIVTKKEKTREEQGTTEYEDDDITDGTLTGGTIGGIGGLLLGAGALAIPGLGPVVAAGPIAAALSGALMGGVAGGLIDWGIPAEVSEHYENRVKEGGILAVIRTSPSNVDKAALVLRQNGAQEVESHNSR
ncbi:general stress protein [Acetonema longum]|uniref:General stress protein 17M-like domain-containing protein n=1 Tax=Acetonema longum DSM 6540 TaxID=1009370 RepID=F7NPF8_9FIRM|nr:general stress protein [Acetonema longum]EGO62120.1 hypothetical protein ALO_20017 [Acetonema longum DSM 6540]